MTYTTPHYDNVDVLPKYIRDAVEHTAKTLSYAVADAFGYSAHEGYVDGTNTLPSYRNPPFSAAGDMRYPVLKNAGEPAKGSRLELLVQHANVAATNEAGGTTDLKVTILFYHEVIIRETSDGVLVVPGEFSTSSIRVLRDGQLLLDIPHGVLHWDDMFFALEGVDPSVASKESLVIGKQLLNHVKTREPQAVAPLGI